MMSTLSSWINENFVKKVFSDTEATFLANAVLKKKVGNVCCLIGRWHVLEAAPTKTSSPPND